jgi:hypothetical protein
MPQQSSPSRRPAVRGSRLVALAALTAASAAVGLATDVGVAQAAPVAGYGFVWADSPSTGSYTPSTPYQANSTGATNTIVRESTGVYVVTMPGIGGEEGNVQVTAYGSSGTQRCKVGGWWPDGTALKIRVHCFTTGGSASDSQYTAHYQAQTSNQSYKQAWVWADDTTGATFFTPNLSWQWNSTGANNTVSRTATGRYTVTFPGQTLSAGNIQVTAYGSSSAYCKVVGWSGTVADVACYTTSGSPTNTQFTAAFTDRRGSTGPVWTQFAHMWGSDASSTSWYTPPTTWNVNSRSAGGGQARKTATGVYEVNLPGQVGFGSTIANTVTVTAYGTSSGTCRVSNWFTTGSAGSGSATIVVRCHTSSGSAVDSQWSLDFSTNTPV